MSIFSRLNGIAQSKASKAFVNNPIVRGLASAGKAGEKYLLKPATETFVSPLGRELVRPFVSTVKSAQALVPGGKSGMGSATSPFGEIKQYKDLTPGETAAGIFEVATAAPGGIIKGAKAASSGIGAIASRAAKPALERLPSSTKLAASLTNTPETAFIAAKKMGTERLQSLIDIVDEPAGIASVGEDIFKAAKRVEETGMKMWQKSQNEIIQNVGRKFLPGLKQARLAVNDLLGAEGIKVARNKVSVQGSQFAEDAFAQQSLQKVVNVLNQKSGDVVSFIRQKTALNNILDGIPLEQKNLRRVLSGAVSKVDEALDTVTGGEYRKLADNYRETVGPARDFINAVSTGGELSLDKAQSFVRQAMSPAKFDKAGILEALDGASAKIFRETGESLPVFLQSVKDLGAAEALARLSPKTGSRIQDVLSSYVITKIPVLSAIVSPNIWARHFAKQGDVAKTAKEAAKNTTNSVRQMIANVALLAAEPGAESQKQTEMQGDFQRSLQSIPSQDTSDLERAFIEALKSQNTSQSNP